MRFGSFCKAVAVSAVLVLAGKAQAADYVRYNQWNTTSTTTDLTESSANANQAGSMWHYEIVDGTATDGSADFGGANAWWKQPATGTSKWNTTQLRWEGDQPGGTGTYPRANNTNLVSSNNTLFGWISRATWTPPAPGSVTISGKINIQTANTQQLGDYEWVIGKRTAAGEYTALANGSVTLTAISVPTLVDLAPLTALQNIPMASGDVLFWTARKKTKVTTANNWYLFDSDTASGGIMTFSFTPSSAVSDWKSR